MNNERQIEEVRHRLNWLADECNRLAAQIDPTGTRPLDTSDKRILKTVSHSLIDGITEDLHHLINKSEPITGEYHDSLETLMMLSVLSK